MSDELLSDMMSAIRAAMSDADVAAMSGERQRYIIVL